MLLGAAGGAAVVAFSQQAPPAPEPTAEVAEPVVASGVEQDTLLLVRVPGESEPATSLTLLAGSSADTGPAVVFVPVGTLAELPGFGLQRLGLAARFGGAGLAEAGVENALGVDIDHVAAVSDEDFAAFLDRSGGLSVSVDEQLIERNDDGTAAVAFEAGEEIMDGDLLSAYWSYRGPDEDEPATFARQRQVLDGLFAALAGDAEVAGRMLADGAPQLGSAADGAWLTAFFGQFARAQAMGELDYDLAPVEPFGSGDSAGDTTYRIDEDELTPFVDRTLAGSRPEGVVDDLVRVHVLNGVGTPGVGEAVDARLEGGGFRIVQTENASSFDFTETRILVYEESEASLAAAERVRELLGVGTIQVSRQPQSVVDVSILVGADLEVGEET